MRPSMSIWTPRRLALLGQELRVREARADHQQRVAALHQVPARLRAEQADRAGDERQVVRQRRLAEQRLRDARAEQLRDLDHLVAGVQRALADEHRDLLAGVQDLGGALEVVVRRDDDRARVADARVDRAVLVRRRRRPRSHRAEVVRDDDAGDRALVERDPDGAVDRGAGSAPARSPSARTRARRP